MTAFLGAASVAACTEERSCFVAGTLVTTPSGDRPIELLAIDDVVLAYDHAERAVVERRISAVHRARANEVRVVEMATERGERLVLHVTPSHPFWVASRDAYVAVRDLHEGDRVLVRRDAVLFEAVVSRIGVHEHATADIEVFNITVEAPTSNYFAAGVLVHNKSYSNPCGENEVTIGTATPVSEDETGTRYRLEVDAIEPLEVKPVGHVWPASAPDEVLVVTSTSSPDRRKWTLEFVLEHRARARLHVGCEVQRANGTSCEVWETTYLPDPGS
ncbi:MAG: Hint domain-containing protein [Myxococcales bacterium]|nr:Hint domain-containing protein [Myxococcales bacterium]